jgi:hypothetical protein
MQALGRATLSQVAAELGESRQRVAEAMQLHLDRGRVSRETILPDAQCAVTGCAHCPLVDACQVRAEPEVGVEVYVWNKAGNHE